MKLPKFISRPWAMTGAPYLLLMAVLSFALLGFTLRADAQRRTSATTTSFDDVVFAIAFSPDARTLAIARGASEPLHRFGRIELWDTETGKLRHLIKGFDGPVRSISFSLDGHTLISASTEFRSSKIQQKPGSREGLTFGELKWWDTRTGELKHKLTMPGERSYSFQATQSPDGKQLALTESFREQFMMVNPTLTQGPAGIDMGLPRAFFRSRLTFKKEMKLVDAKTGELIFKLDADQPGDVSFAPYGNLLAVANGKEVKLWNSQTGKEIRKLRNLRGDANAIAFSPNGRNLAVASTRYEREDAEHFIKIIAISEVKIFDVGTGKIILTLKDVGAVNTLAFSPDGRILVVGGVLPENKGEAAGMKLFNLQTGKVNNLPTGANYKEAVGSLELSHNGGLLAFRAGPATVKLIETENGTMRQTWDADSVGDAVERSNSRFLLSVTRVLVVTFSADGKTVSGESDHGVIKSWDHRTGEVKRHVNIEQDDPSLVAASSDGKSFAEISEGKLLVWDASSDTKRIVPLAGPNTVTALALSPDGRTLVVGRGSEVMLILPSGEVTKTLSGPEGLVSRLAFTNDGRLLAGSEEGGTVYIWNVATGRIEKTLTTVAEVTALVFAPNGETLATAAQDYTIKLWNWRIGLSQGRLQKHEATINALAFSPDGRFLASGGDDRMTVLWEVTTGESKRTFKGHDQTVASLAFSPDGRLLASGSGNASVVLWEVETGKLSRVLK